MNNSNLTMKLTPTTLNKIIPLEIRSPLSLAISCSAWVHKCMGAQKRERECTGLHWRALTLFFSRTTLFCVMDGSFLTDALCAQKGRALRSINFSLLLSAMGMLCVYTHKKSCGGIPQGKNE